MRIFPNPKATDPLVRANEATAVPGNGGMAVKATATSESVVCFASDADPALTAGQELVGRGFDPQHNSVELVRMAIGSGSDGYFGEGRYLLRKK